MRKVAWLAVALLLGACTNTNTVNIIMANESKNDLLQVEVRVVLKEVYAKMQVDTLDHFVLLNEKNQPVDYRLTPDGGTLTFTVDIRGKSQKNYSINKKRPNLADSFLKFRHSNLYLHFK